MGRLGGAIRQSDRTIERCAGFLVTAKLLQESTLDAEEVEVA
jgi:hypothetical protein